MKPAPLPDARDRRIPVLDGYRVIMVFIVSWFHIWQQSWLTPRIGRVSLDFLVRAGYMPVDATILLSGFLLFLPYARAMLLGDPWPDTRTFYRRRVARIMPSYLLITLVMLFAVAIPQKAYSSAGRMLGDVLAHLTFTFTFFRETYLGSPLGGSSWTLCVEAQMYLLFPFIARLCAKHTGATLFGMALMSAYFRGFCLWRMTEYGMVVNQLISFLDVYALGMACALVYIRLCERFKTAQKPLRLQAAATALLVASLVLSVVVLRAQAYSGAHDNIQAGQMARRPLWALCCAGILMSLPFSLRCVRFLFGNRLMRWLSAISMNYYLIHQNLIVQLRHHRIPYSEFDLPNQAGDAVWQWQYTGLAFGLSVLAAVLVTLLVEKPFARLILRPKASGRKA